VSFWNDWRKLHWQMRAWRFAASLRKPAGPVRGTPRVLHLSPSWFADASCIGGGERYPTELAKAMAGIVPTTLLSFSNQRGRASLGKLGMRWLPGRPLDGNASDPLPGTGLAREIARCDILHVHQWRTAASQLATTIAAALGKRVFVTDHGNVATDLSARYRLDGLVAGFLPDSAFAARFLPCGDGAPGLGGGVPSHLLEHEPGPWPREPRVLFLGRLLPHKGLDILVRACVPDLPLTLVGRPYHAEYLRHLRDLGRDGDVEFVLDADDDEVARRLREATVLVLPSVHRDLYGNEHAMPELLGLVLLEAMACGTPVVCSDAGAMPEFVREGETGFVVPWGEVEPLAAALRRLVRDPERARSMGGAARADVLARHTWEHVARRCLDSYARVPAN